MLLGHWHGLLWPSETPWCSIVLIRYSLALACHKPLDKLEGLVVSVVVASMPTRAVQSAVHSHLRQQPYIHVCMRLVAHVVEYLASEAHAFQCFLMSATISLLKAAYLA